MKNAKPLEALFYKAFSKIADYVVRCNILQKPLKALFYKAFAIMIRRKPVFTRVSAGKHAQTIYFIGFLRCNTKFSIFFGLWIYAVCCIGQIGQIGTAGIFEKKLRLFSKKKSHLKISIGRFLVKI